MQRTLLIVSMAACSLTPVVRDQRDGPDLERLYQARQWFDLRKAITRTAPPLVRGAVAVAFNHADEAERLLRGVIRAGPRSTAADDAYHELARIYFRSGQYARLLHTYLEWRAKVPNSTQLREEQAVIDEFSGRPDQIDGRSRPATLRHEADSFSVPVSINGKTDEFLIDTGAWQSVLTDREARKLGLTVETEARTLTGASGDTARFHTAVARDVLVGATRFHDVSFAVLEPTGPLGDVEGGILGMPILLGLGSVRWSKDGTTTLGARGKAAPPNLVFDGDRLLLRSGVLGEITLVIVDTGADTTDLNANFAERFPGAVEHGKRGTHDVTGAGGTETFESVELSEVSFAIGGTRAFLRPAYVTLQRIALMGASCCIGNVGRDVLAQHQSLSIDFSTMTLEMK